MALELLGSKYCIDSLREDVTDLQDAVIDVFSRAGPVRVPSWKYPDKCASDLDMTELLELYDYSEDAEERQIAHIVLLELVIDRLILLLQAMSKFMDQGLGAGKNNVSPAASNKNSTSIGLVVKKYWNKLVQSTGALTQANSDMKKQKRKIADLENTLKAESAQKQELQAVTETLNETLRTAQTPFPLSDIDQVLSRATSAISISRDECIKSTQTIETAFVPCEACHCVQQNFRQVGGQVIQMVQSHGLPSNLAKHRKDMEGIDWLTDRDVIRWATEQNADMKRLEKLLSDFDQLQLDLKGEKQKVNDSKKKIADCEKEIKLERETQATQRKHYEKKIENVEKGKEEAVTQAKRKTEEVEKNKQRLEKQLGEMKNQFSNQEQMLSQLETAKQKVERELEESLTNNAEVKRLEQDVDKVEAKLQEMTSKLKTAEQDLNRERAKSKSSDKHTQSIQSKQDQLLQRLDDLDRENDDLRTEVAELEETKEKLEENLDKAKDEQRKLKDKHREGEAIIKKLKRDKESLEESMVDLQTEIHKLETTVQEANEKYQLLVEYPDLNGPVNPDIQGTGDLAKDMENQVKANSARIQLLEQQNTKLRHTITKILQSRQTTSQPQMAGAPVPLWRTKTPVEEEKSYRNESLHHPMPSKTQAKPPQKPSAKLKDKSPDEIDPRFSVIIGKGAVGRGNDRSKSRGSRPSSAVKSNSHTSQQAALKKTILGQRGSGRPGSSKSDYERQEVFTCSRCDKIYSSARDLDIHQSYCTS